MYMQSTGKQITHGSFDDNLNLFITLFNISQIWIHYLSVLDLKLPIKTDFPIQLYIINHIYPTDSQQTVGGANRVTVSQQYADFVPDINYLTSLPTKKHFTCI